MHCWSYTPPLGNPSFLIRLGLTQNVVSNPLVARSRVVLVMNLFLFSCFSFCWYACLSRFYSKKNKHVFDSHQKLMLRGRDSAPISPVSIVSCPPPKNSSKCPPDNLRRVPPAILPMAFKIEGLISRGAWYMTDRDFFDGACWVVCK
jgi:hypothetical protein